MVFRVDWLAKRRKNVNGWKRDENAKMLFSEFLVHKNCVEAD
jgi:hypothetical protein